MMKGKSYPTMIVGVAGILASPGSSSPNFNLPLESRYTLRNRTPLTLELDYHRQIEGSHPRTYTYPRSCRSDVDSSDFCQQPFRLGFSDSVSDKNISVSPVMAYEYRYLGENVSAGEGGLNLWGNSGPASFYLDARMFTEVHEDHRLGSFDREYTESQTEKESHGLAYTSYSRYRANLSLDWPWGRLTIARDAAHWGPGLFGNLVFNQQAVPFDQLVFSTRLGPLSVTSLYGRLTVSDPGEFPTDSVSRSVYAHRYEWSPSSRWTLGISEQLILFDTEAPFDFVPIVPLYIAKAYSAESRNNGNLAFDCSYLLFGKSTLYTEFLIDDLKSPSGLFDDRWYNKWGWLAGLHAIKNIGSRKSGVVLEYSRIEPWVYTHYFRKTAQAANQGFPLGNPNGPNSQQIQTEIYLKWSEKLVSSMTVSGLWKGTDPGSSLTDTMDEHSDAGKVFLGGAGSPDLGLSFRLWANLGPLTMESDLSFRDNPEAKLRAEYRY